MNTLKRFIKDDRGLETVEWAVIAALIVAGLVIVIGNLGDAVNSKFGELENAVNQ
ncbi:MAG: Flp family type IVb pilin [Planctomycetota bacterium]